jgi:hypothetical protein
MVGVETEVGKARREREDDERACKSCGVRRRDAKMRFVECCLRLKFEW